jgi:hypothetical protein
MLARLARVRFLLLVVPLLGIASAVATGCGGRTDDYVQPDGSGAGAATANGNGDGNGYGYGYGYGYGP